MLRQESLVGGRCVRHELGAQAQSWAMTPSVIDLQLRKYPSSSSFNRDCNDVYLVGSISISGVAYWIVASDTDLYSLLAFVPSLTCVSASTSPYVIGYIYHGHRSIPSL